MRTRTVQSSLSSLFPCLFLCPLTVLVFFCAVSQKQLKLGRPPDAKYKHMDCTRNRLMDTRDSTSQYKQRAKWTMRQDDLGANNRFDSPRYRSSWHHDKKPLPWLLPLPHQESSNFVTMSSPAGCSSHFHCITVLLFVVPQRKLQKSFQFCNTDTANEHHANKP